jgi:hypothetical protein
MFAVLYYSGSITGDATVQKEHHSFLGFGGVGVEVETSVEVLDHLVGMLEFNSTMLSNKFKKKEVVAQQHKSPTLNPRLVQEEGGCCQKAQEHTT